MEYMEMEWLQARLSPRWNDGAHEWAREKPVDRGARRLRMTRAGRQRERRLSVVDFAVLT